MKHRTRQSRLLLFALSGVLGAVCPAGAVEYPPLTTEIGAEHPLFLFEGGAPEGLEPLDYVGHVLDAWAALPEDLRPYSLMMVDAGSAARHERNVAILQAFQEVGVPVAVRVAAGEDARRGDLYDLKALEGLLARFTVMRGIEARGLQFNRYDPSLGMEPVAAWLMGAIEAAARYGRFVNVPLDEVHWARVMSNVGCAPLYARIQECAAYVIPASWERGGHHLARQSALMGLWLEGAADRWGVAADSRWYTDARFISPGVFGAPGIGTRVPASVYRAQILLGAMGGASVYSFGVGEDLWYGENRYHWDEAIAPVLDSLLDDGLIPRKFFVAEKARVAYQMAPSATPVDFHANLRDIDGVLDEGRLIHGAYGMERAGQIPELVPNRNGTYWIPLLSYHASEAVRSSFDAVLAPGTLPSADEWRMFAERYRKPDGEGDAYIAHVGRGVFIMNTWENMAAAQQYAIPNMPAPVRGFTVRREGAGAEIRWPFREGDVSYQVYRRILPETRYAKIAGGLDRRNYSDPDLRPDASAAYAVTALTNEQERFSGTLGYGEYLALSTVESRIVEEALLTPLMSQTVSQSLARPAPEATVSPWWPNIEGVEPGQKAQATAIIERIEAWDKAITSEDLNAVLNIYSTEYEDPQGWQFQYVRRAWQWLFQGYSALHLHRQIRRWDFDSYAASGQVHVLLYCRVTGIALTGPSGVIADLPIAIPRTQASEVWTTWVDNGGVWRLQSTNPALPNFADILSYSASPYAPIPEGPDIYQGPGR